MELSSLQNEVLNRVKDRLKDSADYQGVCLVGFPSDKDIQEYGMECAILKVILTTEICNEPRLLHK